MEKKGVSPVIATVLLITIALVLAVIIFLWARSFISEKVQKFGEPIENSCQKIQFDAEVTSLTGDVLTIDVQNQANVPLYGLEVRKKDVGSIINVGTGGKTLDSGQTDTMYINVQPGDISSGSDVILVPVIIGEAGNIKKAYTCSQQYGVDRTVP